MNSDANSQKSENEDKTDSTASFQSDNRSIYCSMRIRKENDLLNEDFLSNKRESSQMQIFVNQFIKPEIKSAETPPLHKLRRKLSRKSLHFNLLVIGEAGLGKGTFIQSIISENSIKKENMKVQPEELEKDLGYGLVSKIYLIAKENQKICLNIIHNHDYGTGLKSDTTFSNIMEYINGTFRECFKFECSLDRSSIEDRKIHCCLYFISPYGHSLKPLDIEFMKMFQTKLNIIPIIAKADIFNQVELQNFKQNILNDFEKHNINLFGYYANCDSCVDYNEDVQDMCDELKENVPLSVILSNEKIVNNKKQEEKVRQYSWGVVKTDDCENSQFLLLENILLKSHIIYFKTITKSVHYENYRVQFILQHVNENSDDPNEYSNLI